MKKHLPKSTRRGWHLIALPLPLIIIFISVNYFFFHITLSLLALRYERQILTLLATFIQGHAVVGFVLGVALAAPPLFLLRWWIPRLLGSVDHNTNAQIGATLLAIGLTYLFGLPAFVLIGQFNVRFADSPPLDDFAAWRVAGSDIGVIVGLLAIGLPLFWRGTTRRTSSRRNN